MAVTLVGTCEWSASVLGLLGAFLLATNSRASRYGWPAFLVANVAMMIFAQQVSQCVWPSAATTGALWEPIASVCTAPACGPRKERKMNRHECDAKRAIDRFLAAMAGRHDIPGIIIFSRAISRRRSSCPFRGICNKFALRDKKWHITQTHCKYPRDASTPLQRPRCL